MNPAGRVSRLSAFSLKLPLAAGLAALLLSACVDTNASAPAGAPTEALLDQPPINTDATIYAARADGQFAIPGLPVEQIPESHRRQVVDYPSEQPPGTIIIDPTTKLLYYVLGKNKALRYGISVGAEGFQWSGEAIVSRKREWPTWTPPSEMIDRKPSLEKWRNGQPGGPTNPLGSRAIYLTSNGVDYGYRIHGTPEWKSIGRNASSGCFRMINQDVMDLFERVKGGEKVIVLTAKGEMPSKLNIPKPPAPKKKAPEAPKVEAPELTMMGPPPGLIGPVPAPADAAAGDTPPEAAVAPALPGAAPLALPSAAPVITPGTGATPSAPPAPAPSASPAETPAAAPAATETAPAAPAAPAVTPAPAASPTAPACAVPLVNGSCPG